MHELIILVDLRGVSLTCKSGKSLLENVDSQGLITCDENVDTEVEFVTVDQQRVGNIP